MTQKQQKILSTALVTIAAFLGFQSLINIINLNQAREFLLSATYLFVFFWLMILVLFDLHFKNRGAYQRAKFKHESIEHFFQKQVNILATALKDRLTHLFKFSELKHALNYLILPALIFWSTVGVIFLNLGQVQIQQFYAFLSTMALGLSFWFIKEVFTRRKEIVDQDVFVVLSLVKIFTAALSFGVLMAAMRYYCLDPKFYASSLFVVAYLLLHQALFQHNRLSPKTQSHILLISLALSAIGYIVYLYWGFNYFTAAIFLGAFYNFFWGVYHFYLDRSLTKKAFWEIFLISALIAYLVFINTNFSARILNGCF
jgi:hypothetical protein